MKKALLRIALLLSLAVTSRAEVLIYKGNGSAHVPPGSGIPAKIELYLLFDVDAKQIASLLFFKAGGDKIVSGGAPSSIHTTTSPLDGGGTVRLFSSGNASETEPDFQESLFFLRGTQKTITVKNGSLTITRNEPKVLNGFSVNASENSGVGRFVDLRVSTTYQQAATIKANNANQTLQQAYDELNQELLDKGYMLP